MTVNAEEQRSSHNPFAFRTNIDWNSGPFFFAPMQLSLPVEV